jgi:SWI/SNF-related matrix-associated actin-dependent regulator 1 of chromatin subfamily A
MLNLFKHLRIVNITDDRETYVVTVPSEDEQEHVKKHVPGARWQPSTLSFHIPANWQNTRALLVHFRMPWSANAEAFARKSRPLELTRIEASRASDAVLELPGFGKQPFPFQRGGIKYAIERERVIVGDEMGLGKTIQGLGTVFLTQAYPCLVITPASLKYNWGESEIPACLPGKLVVVADKDTGELLLQMADVIVTNYEQLVGFRTYDSVTTDPITGKVTKRKKRTSWTDASKRKVILSPLAEKLQRLQLKSIICDEAHYLKEPTAARTHAVMALRHGVKYRLLLTGTAMLNKPAELFPLLRFLDRSDEFGGYMHFLQHYCGLRKGAWGPEAKQAFHTQSLNDRLRASCYIRRLKKDVLKELPPKLRTSYRIEIDNREEYEQAERELVEWVKNRVLQNEEFMASIAHLPPEERQLAIRAHQNDKAERAQRAEAIVRIGALKAVSAEGKRAAAKEWIDNFLESGEKLVVFATGKKILNWLQQKYPNAAFIRSEQGAHERQDNVKRFQNDPACNLIILAMGTSATNSPGGVGHTLTKASNVLFIELGWNNALHDQCEDRCHRIGQQDNVTAHYLLGRNTIDIDIAELIESKRVVSKRVLDGGEPEDESSILHELMDRLAGRG